MTARDHARSSAQRAGERDRGRPEPAGPPGPLLGEVLLAAREAKGVDLYRAERDTKIRVKYLSALERSEFRELPGAVYTKGFLRNYAMYLGLDPDEVLDQWRREGGAARPTGPMIIAPQPLEAPRGGFTFTPGVLVAAVLTLIIAAVVGYIALQLARSVQPPMLSVTSPGEVVSTVDADHLLIAGTSDPGVTVTIQASGNQTYRFSADSTGAWSRDVPLSKGENQMTITATDPATAKVSPPWNLIINVPIPPTPTGPAIALTSPADGAAVNGGAVAIAGTTSGTSVTITAVAAGPTTPVATGKPTPAPVAPPAPLHLTVGTDGAFKGTYQLPPGRWTVTATATSGGGTTAVSHTVTVAIAGIVLTVDIKGGSAWIKVWVDGQVVPSYTGVTVRAGTRLQFTGKHSVEVRTGSAGATYFTVNGVAIGPLGGPGMPQTWLFQPGKAPQKTSHT
ncbi:MAG TPA: RodZ domain-containing protein [Candidatus Baltobacteraceae bacterium]|nr:RodZ domain-containing protein [Candidatus Baltobacteraceae bacterium]